MTISTNNGSVLINGDGTATILDGSVPSAIGTAPVLYPPVNPDQTPQVSEKPDIITAQFGDGYSQRYPRGMNNIAMTQSLAWSLLTLEQRDDMLGFFRALSGYLPFWYALPEDPLRLWIAPSWSYSGVTYGLWSVSASLQRVYDQVA